MKTHTKNIIIIPATDFLFIILYPHEFVVIYIIIIYNISKKSINIQKPFAKKSIIFNLTVFNAK